jgi:hypothetical protein
MRPERKILLSSDVWRLAITSVKSTWRQTALLVGVGLILPQLVVNLGLDLASHPVVSELRAIFTSKMATSGSPLAFNQLIAPVLNYLGRVATVAIILSLLLLASFLGLVQTAIDHHRELSPRGSLAVWFIGLKKALPAGMSLFLLLLFVGLAGQIVILPALLIGVLGLMIPAILMSESRGIGSALWSAITLRFIRGTGFSGWTVVLNVMSLWAFLYGTMAVIGILSELLLFLDETIGVSRNLWVTVIPGLDNTPIYSVVAVMESVLSMACLGLLPSLTTALYFIVRRGGEGRPIARV